MSLLSEAERVDRLTKRELQILYWLSHGLRVKEVATQLDIKPDTARTHAQNVLVKLGVHTQAGAVGIVMRVQMRHLLPPRPDVQSGVRHQGTDLLR